MAKAARKAKAKKAPKKPARPAAKAANKAVKKVARIKARAKPVKKTIPKKALRKQAGVKRKPAPKMPSRKIAARMKPARGKKATRPAAPAPERHLMVVEPNKPPMVASPASPPATVPVQPPPRAQPSEPPHLDASRHDSGPLAIPLTPALELLPDWEDRLRLKRAVFEDGLAFFSLSRGCPEYHEAMIALSKTGKAAHEETTGYFIVCMKDRTGAMVGAMDGHMLGNAVMHVGRSFVRGEKRREMHILLYSAALSGHTPDYILFSCSKPALNVDLAAKLILLGRGMGFCGIQMNKPGALVFIRRVRRELDPISSGKEIAQALEGADALFGTEKESAELRGKGVVPLVPLPTSPDSREHLHELRDVVQALELDAPDLDAVLETLRSEYLLQRKDLTPGLLF